jgi:hypothetical protein
VGVGVASGVVVAVGVGVAVGVAGGVVVAVGVGVGVGVAGGVAVAVGVAVGVGVAGGEGVGVGLWQPTLSLTVIVSIRQPVPDPLQSVARRKRRRTFWPSAPTGIWANVWT